MDNSGAIIGPLLACLILYLTHNHFQSLFLWATLPALLGVLAVIIGIKEERTIAKAKSKRLSVRQLPKRYFLFLLVIFIFSLGNSSDALLLIKASETVVDKAWIPFMYMITNVTSVMLAIPIGKLSDRIGREKLITAGFAVYAVTYLLFGRLNSFAAFMPLFALYGVYGALTDVSQKSFISDITDKDMKGSGYGLYHATLGLTLLPASFIGGWMYDHINNQLPFYFGATMALIASLLMYLLFIRKRKGIP